MCQSHFKEQNNYNEKCELAHLMDVVTESSPRQTILLF